MLVYKTLYKRCVYGVLLKCVWKIESFKIICEVKEMVNVFPWVVFAYLTFKCFQYSKECEASST